MESETLRWAVAGLLMALFSWVAISFFVDLPWKAVDVSRPEKKAAGYILMAVCAGAGLAIVPGLMEFVWLGLKMVLFLDMDQIID